MIITKNWVRQNYNGEECFEIPKGVTEIAEGAFEGCESLKYVSIPEGVTKIDVGAFKGCNRLKEVNLPKSLTDIADNAFERSVALTQIFDISFIWGDRTNEKLRYIPPKSKYKDSEGNKKE